MAEAFLKSLNQNPEMQAFMKEMGPDFKFPEWQWRMNRIDSCSSDEGEKAQQESQQQGGGDGEGAPQGQEAQEPEDVAEKEDDGDLRFKIEHGPMPTRHLMHDLASIGRIDKMAKQLDGKGTSINVQDTLGETPLFYATSAEVIDFLVGEGADIEWRNKLCNCSAFYKFACQGKHKPLKALAKHLRKAGRLSEYVNDPSSHTKRTPLHAAAHNGYTETVKELLAMGADKGLPDYVGKTALELAKARGFDSCVALLE
mmetsp:Transcript_86968/g.246558  ORF Transcript_86968/g.246558 Transcript_86968/m.246558 type:complete len:256 (-) Transcript_86968:279-1046(-)